MGYTFISYLYFIACKLQANNLVPCKNICFRHIVVCSLTFLNSPLCFDDVISFSNQKRERIQLLGSDWLIENECFPLYPILNCHTPFELFYYINCFRMFRRILLIRHLNRNKTDIIQSIKNESKKDKILKPLTNAMPIRH